MKMNSLLNMKNRHLSVWLQRGMLLALFATVLIGCRKEERNAPNGGGNELSVRINFEAEENEVVVRAAEEVGSDIENKIAKIDLFIFDTATQSFLAHEEFTPTSGQNNNTLYSHTFKLAPGQIDVIAIANMPQGTSFGATPTKASLDALSIGTQGTMPTPKDGSLAIMRGEGSYTITQDATIDIPMLRRIAAVEVETDKFVISDDPNNYKAVEIEGWELYYYQSKGLVSGTAVTDAASEATGRGASSTFDKLRKYTYPISKELANGGNATALLVKGTYVDGSKRTVGYYLLPINVINNKQELLPNHLYKIKIAGATGPGYNTPEEALQGGSMGNKILYTVSDWNNKNQNSITFFGNYYLKVEQHSLLFDNARQSSTLEVRTNAPGLTVIPPVETDFVVSPSGTSYVPTTVPATWSTVSVMPSDKPSHEPKEKVYNLNIGVFKNESSKNRMASTIVQATGIHTTLLRVAILFEQLNSRKYVSQVTNFNIQPDRFFQSGNEEVIHRAKITTTLPRQEWVLNEVEWMWKQNRSGQWLQSERKFIESITFNHSVITFDNEGRFATIARRDVDTDTYQLTYHSNTVGDPYYWRIKTINGQTVEYMSKDTSDWKAFMTITKIGGHEVDRLPYRHLISGVGNSDLEIKVRKGMSANELNWVILHFTSGEGILNYNWRVSVNLGYDLDYKITYPTLGNEGRPIYAKDMKRSRYVIETPLEQTRPLTYPMTVNSNGKCDVLIEPENPAYRAEAEKWITINKGRNVGDGNVVGKIVNRNFSITVQPNTTPVALNQQDGHYPRARQATVRIYLYEDTNNSAEPRYMVRYHDITVYQGGFVTINGRDWLDRNLKTGYWFSKEHPAGAEKYEDPQVYVERATSPESLKDENYAMLYPYANPVGLPTNVYGAYAKFNTYRPWDERAGDDGYFFMGAPTSAKAGWGSGTANDKTYVVAHLWRGYTRDYDPISEKRMDNVVKTYKKDKLALSSNPVKGWEPAPYTTPCPPGWRVPRKSDWNGIEAIMKRNYTTYGQSEIEGETVSTLPGDFVGIKNNGAYIRVVGIPGVAGGDRAFVDWFLPAAGRRLLGDNTSATQLDLSGDHGLYYCSDEITDANGKSSEQEAYCFTFNSGGVGFAIVNPGVCASVRCIRIAE